MERTEKISIIIPVYNAERTLDRCLQGLCNQTYDNLEIILVDDGSTDGSSQLIDKWKDSDSRIVVVHQENKGASAARNRGLDIVTGEYCGFLDADDYVEPQMYERLREAMIRDGSDIASVSIREIYNGDVCKERKNTEDAMVMTGKEALCRMLTYSDGVRVVVWDKLYRTELLAHVRFEESYVYGEDAWFNFNALLLCPKYSRISYIGYTYDHRASQVTNKGYRKATMSNVYGTIKMRKAVDNLDKAECDELMREQLCKAVNWFSVNMYRTILREIIVQGDYRGKDKSEYTELKDIAQKMKRSNVRTNVTFKDLVQWKLMLYCPMLYRVIYKIKH